MLFILRLHKCHQNITSFTDFPRIYSTLPIWKSLLFVIPEQFSLPFLWLLLLSFFLFLFLRCHYFLYWAHGSDIYGFATHVSYLFAPGSHFFKFLPSYEILFPVVFPRILIQFSSVTIIVWFLYWIFKFRNNAFISSRIFFYDLIASP